MKPYYLLFTNLKRVKFHLKALRTVGLEGTLGVHLIVLARIHIWVIGALLFLWFCAYQANKFVLFIVELYHCPIFVCKKRWNYIASFVR